MKKSESLVLSGGGARGAYQLGVWKALRKLHLDKNIVSVYGTSVGAINGAAFVQGDFETAEKLWKKLNFEMIFQSINFSEDTAYPKRLYQFAQQTIKHNGMDVTPLKELLRNSLDEKKIRNSPIDFGLVVFDWKKKRPKYLRKNDIPYGYLIEYIIASSTFYPIFRPHAIGKESYIDGGIYDNRPLAFCEHRKDINKIYCIDVTIARHFWRNKKPKMTDKITYIRPSRLLGSPMSFVPKRINKNIELGFINAMHQLS